MPQTKYNVLKRLKMRQNINNKTHKKRDWKKSSPKKETKY